MTQNIESIEAEMIVESGDEPVTPEVVDDKPKGEIKNDEPKDEENKSSEEKESDKDEPGEDTERPREKRRNGFSKKINKLTARLHENEARISQLTAELEAAKTAKPVDKKPVQEDFETYAEFTEALVDYKTKAKEPEAPQPKATNDDKLTADESEEIGEILSEGKAKYKDFDDKVLNRDLALTPTVLRVVAESDVADDVLYHLGSNPDLTAKLAKMSLTAIALEVGKIEAQLTAPKPKPTKKVTAAPEPFTPVDSRGGSVQKSEDDMSMDEFYEHMNAQERRKRGYR